MSRFLGIYAITPRTPHEYAFDQTIPLETSWHILPIQLCFNEPQIWTLLIYISYLYTASKISTFIIVNASDKKVCNSCKEKEKRMFNLPQSAARSATLLLLDLDTERPQCRMILSPPRWEPDMKNIQGIREWKILFNTLCLCTPFGTHQRST